MDIINLYTDILKDAGLVVDNSGFVSINNAMFNGKDKNDPVLLDGKRLVLPTHNQLAAGDGDSKIVFHPLSENLLRGESLVVTKLRSLYTTRLNFTIAITVSHLLQLCASINKHKTLNPDQSAVLSFAADCDETTVNNFNSLVQKVLAEDSNFVRIYLKRAGIIKGNKFARAGIVSFPFFEELEKTQETYYGVKLRKKDKESILSIFKFILKDIDQPDSYNRGSNSDIAPFLDALMKTFLIIAAELNDVIVTYGDIYEDLKKLEFSCEWQETFKDLSMMNREIRKIPSQPGNEGESRKVELPVTGTPQNTLAFNPGTIAPEPVQQQYSHAPQKAPEVTNDGSKKVSFAELMSQSVSHPPPQMYQQPYPQQMGYNPNMQQYPQQNVQLPPSLMSAPNQGGFNNPNTGYPSSNMTPNQIIQGNYPHGMNQNFNQGPGAPRSPASMPMPMGGMPMQGMPGMMPNPNMQYPQNFNPGFNRPNF